MGCSGLAALVGPSNEGHPLGRVRSGASARNCLLVGSGDRRTAVVGAQFTGLVGERLNTVTTPCLGGCWRRHLGGPILPPTVARPHGVSPLGRAKDQDGALM